jgi:hypothetical protein
VAARFGNVSVNFAERSKVIPQSGRRALVIRCQSERGTHLEKSLGCLIGNFEREGVTKILTQRQCWSPARGSAPIGQRVNNFAAAGDVWLTVLTNIN